MWPLTGAAEVEGPGPRTVHQESWVLDLAFLGMQAGLGHSLGCACVPWATHTVLSSRVLTSGSLPLSSPVVFGLDPAFPLLPHPALLLLVLPVSPAFLSGWPRPRLSMNQAESVHEGRLEGSNQETCPASGPCQPSSEVLAEDLQPWQGLETAGAMT